MKKLIIFTIVILMCVICFASCERNQYGNVEYEVLTIAPYTIITGRNDNGPVEESRLAFIYMDNGDPQLISNYYEDDSPQYGQYILVGDSNKYVVVNEYRNRTEYLYLTQETYNSLFPESEK